MKLRNTHTHSIQKEAGLLEVKGQVEGDLGDIMGIYSQSENQMQTEMLTFL